VISFQNSCIYVLCVSFRGFEIIDPCLMFITFLNDSGYLFEGHLTVDPEPPQPQWLVQSNLLTTAATLFAAESSQASEANETTQDDATNMLEDLLNRLEEVVPLVFIQNIPCAFDYHRSLQLQFYALKYHNGFEFLGLVSEVG